MTERKARKEKDSSGGSQATRPSEFGWRDWKAILGGVWKGAERDRLSLVAAGVAFYFMLAFIPAIGAIIGLYGLIADPAAVADHLQVLRRLLPESAFEIVDAQVGKLVRQQSGTLGVASLLAILVAFWGARRGVFSLVLGLNVVYDEVDSRSFLRQILLTLVLTALLIVVALVTIVAVVLAPAAIGLLPLGDLGAWVAEVARWPIALFAVVVGLVVLYRYGPNRARPRLRWVTWGAAIATLLWLAGSMLFSLYVSNFASYNETYGSLGAIVGLLIWFYLSAFAMLLGAELNAEMERRTTLDTTVGRRRPRGERGAYVADHDERRPLGRGER